MGKRELVALLCLPGVSWWLSGSSSRYHEVVCGLWLWYFLIIFPYFFVCNILSTPRCESQVPAKKTKNLCCFGWNIRDRLTPIHVLCNCYAKIFCGLNVFQSFLVQCVVVKILFVWMMPSHSHKVTLLIALLNLSSWCLVMVERLFLAVPRGCLQFVIVVFPDHTHLLFLATLNFICLLAPQRARLSSLFRV